MKMNAEVERCSRHYRQLPRRRGLALSCPFVVFSLSIREIMVVMAMRVTRQGEGEQLKFDA